MGVRHEACRVEASAGALVAETKRAVGPDCNLLLLSAPRAMTYYPRIGMERVENGFIIRRDG
jgi:hypothetical protein